VKALRAQIDAGAYQVPAEQGGDALLEYMRMLGLGDIARVSALSRPGLQ
jgi:hypothetical protein